MTEKEGGYDLKRLHSPKGPTDKYTPLIIRNLDKKHLLSVVCSVSFGSDISGEKDAVRNGKVTGHGSEVDDYLKQNHLSI